MATNVDKDDHDDDDDGDDDHHHHYTYLKKKHKLWLHTPLVLMFLLWLVSVGCYSHDGRGKLKKRHSPGAPPGWAILYTMLCRLH